MIVASRAKPGLSGAIGGGQMLRAKVMQLAAGPAIFSSVTIELS